MGKKKPTISDVAKKSGVSLSITRKIIGNTYQGPEEPRIKVLRAVEALGYKREIRDREGRSNTIALLAPFFFAPFVSEMVDGIEKKIVGTPYNASQYSTKGILENESAIIHRILRTGVADAFILFNIPVDEDILRELKKRKVPVVSMEREIPFFTCITTDNMQGSYLGTEHLIKTGKKNIAIVIGKRYLPDIQNERIKGYMKALDDHGLEFKDDNIIVITYHDFDHGVDTFNNIIKNRPDIDAIFCMAGDIVATGIMAAAKSQGVKIPEQLAIIGYDDLEVARYVTPPLTTIRQPARKMGEKAVEIVIDELESKGTKVPMEVVFKSELIKRGSA